MNNPMSPSYLGSWDELVNALLHNPFLGGGRGGVPPRVKAEMSREGGPEMGPQPDPWFVSTATSFLTSLIALKQVASHLDGEGRAFERAADRALEEMLDEFCGTAPHVPPRPWPLVVGVELIAFARSLPDGELKSRIIAIGGTVVQRSVGAAAPRELGIGA
jgi:hypothetical protein